MNDITKTLKIIADNLKRHELATIANGLTRQEKEEFVNAIRALQVPADFMSKGL